MKNKILLPIILVGLIIFVSGCIFKPTPPESTPPESTPSEPTPHEPEESTLKTEPVNLFGIETEKAGFAKNYKIAGLDIPLKVSQYELPLSTRQIANFSSFSGQLTLSKNAQSFLEKNGFVALESPFDPKGEDITEPYKTLKDKEIPIFITTDSLLHLYHIQFDETLRQIEEREFYDKIWQISQELLNDSMGKYDNATGDLKEALKRNIAYFSVGLELLKPKKDQIGTAEDPWSLERDESKFEKGEAGKYKFSLPDLVKEEVEKELDLIKAHQGFSESPIFIYKEDYSQYVPRGHYTRSEKLKNYFKAMMWYGRISMLLRKDLFLPRPDAAEQAKIQTMGAALITSEFAKNKELKEKWDRIYSVTSFYVGLSDDLGPYEYLEAMNSVFGPTFDPNSLDTETVGKLKAELAEYRAPKIYGGTGDCVILPPFTPEQADECLEATKGFRLMGQRFIPDSYMFSRLVSPYVGMYAGSGNPFTMCMAARCFPRGLDVMALLGSKRAKELLIEMGDTEYAGQDAQGNKTSYQIQFNKLKEEFNKFTEADWQKNLYWSWLYGLKPLLKEFGPGYPTFMQTAAWQDKSLTTALASWAELRHDTILYAKQSYTPRLTAMPLVEPEKPVIGYVEPIPEFYNRLLGLTQMTNKGLSEMEVLDSVSKSRLDNLEKILEKLVDISKRELENKELAQEDYDFIKNFGDQLNGVISDVDDKAKKTTIIADVHTDSNTSRVLEEGVGYVKLIAVAYKVPDGRILIGAGPVMTYYEFKHPMSDRLTDESWRDLLKTRAPEPPEWVANFSE